MHFLRMEGAIDMAKLSNSPFELCFEKDPVSRYLINELCSQFICAFACPHAQ